MASEQAKDQAQNRVEDKGTTILAATVKPRHYSFTSTYDDQITRK